MGCFDLFSHIMYCDISNAHTVFLVIRIQWRSDLLPLLHVFPSYPSPSIPPSFLPLHFIRSSSAANVQSQLLLKLFTRNSASLFAHFFSRDSLPVRLFYTHTNNRFSSSASLPSLSLSGQRLAPINRPRSPQSKSRARVEVV